VAADRLRDALSELVDDGHVPASVRTEISDSWRRSVQAGLRPEQLDVPFDTTVDSDVPLVRAAVPVLDDLIGDLAGAIVCVVLTDECSHVIDRRVAHPGLRGELDANAMVPGSVYAEGRIGTNAIGTALAQQAPLMVVGTEHFADAFTAMACAAVPLADPQSGRLIGVIDLTCRARDVSPLMLSLARRGAHEIEQRLVDDKGIAERVLLQHFLQRRRGAKGPLVFVSDQRMITNGAADHLVSPDDAAVLWEQATRVLANDRAGRSDLVLTGGATVALACEPVFDGGTLLGALVRLRPSNTNEGASAAQLADRKTNGLTGLTGLTDTEQSVAALATQGLTNREVAERLFMSRYTVDSHLRSIYRKLGVNSRVALTRAVLGTSDIR
jgi:transcriptional regulator of acetoin/glycerol metabolism/DNA-binding CsgD family transcriptional regulator